MKLRVLSIRQPWAWLITRPDIKDPVEREHAARTGILKDIENRVWSTNVRGGFLIHASKGMTANELLAAIDFADAAWDGKSLLSGRYPLLGKGSEELDIQRGGIVGYAKITDCVRQSESRWFVGDYGFKLEDQRPLPYLPTSGKLGFFWADIPDEYVCANLPEFLEPPR